MRALMISPAMPALTGGGLSMRMGLFLNGLSAIADTDLLVLPLGGLPKHQERLDQHFKATCQIISTVGREDTLFKLIGRLQDENQRLESFRRYGRSSLAASLSVAVKADITRAVLGQTYDIVHVGRCYLGEAALPIEGEAVKTLDADENDAEVFERQARLESVAGDEGRAAFHMAEAEACEREQATILSKFDAVYASSENEVQSLRHYRVGKPLHVVPNAVVRPKALVHQDDGHTLLFVGSLGFWPNREGLHWFLQEVWPLLMARSGNPLRLMIVGRDCGPDIRRLSNIAGISVHSDVANLGEFYARATAAIVPLRAGGGTRIKIIEAAMHGVPVVSTHVGAEGLSFADGREILLAKDAQHMAHQIAFTLSNPPQRRSLGHNAQILAQAKYSFEAVSEQLACNWMELLAKRRAGGILPG